MESMSSEGSMMVITRSLLQRFGDSNLGYIVERSTDVLGRLLHYYREKSVKVIRANTFVMPEGMRYLPYFVYCLKHSDLLSKGKIRDISKLEVQRRELTKCEPLQFILRLVPQLYSLEFYLHPLNTEDFVIPPTLSPSKSNVKEGRKPYVT